METYSIRINENDWLFLLSLLAKIKFADQEKQEKLNRLIKTLQQAKKRKKSDKVHNAIMKATATRQRRTQAKIISAIEKLRKENKPINAYQVAKRAGVAYTTARSYLRKIENF